jgi:hypothetical protein
MVIRHPLAAMDGLLRALTWICLGIPIALGLAGWQTPMPLRAVLLGATAAVVAIYAFIWLWMRPISFVVEPDALTIVWPLRRRRIEAAAVTAARILDRHQLRRELGRILRIGAGGLGGGFGLARTSRGLVELWVSRTDWMVFVECAGRRSLLVTPDDPEGFVRELVPGAA